MTDFGANPAFVPAASSQQAVSTKGFNPGEAECPYGADEPSRAIAWHKGYRAGLKEAGAIFDRTFGKPAQSTGDEQ